MMKLGIHKLDDDVILPVRATEKSSCYDVHAFLKPSTLINFYVKGGQQQREVTKDGYVLVRPSERVQVPTGLALDIPDTHDVKLYPRSGLALKKGITLSNCTAVIDSDYKEELFVTIINNSQDNFKLENGERIAQLEPNEKVEYTIEEVKEKPQRTTTRKGGLGSTGRKTVKKSNEVKEKTVEE